ncbi:MAG: AAA family ATPase [Candidatus Dormibacteria bacterium]
MQVCADCGERNPNRARYCMRCARPLAEGREQQLRKIVTVIFSDLVGSTALGEQLDPEPYRRVISLYLDAMTRVIKAHHGIVDKVFGDGLLAVWGLPRAREDDALRALRAADEMRVELARLNQQIGGEWGVRLAARTGVNSGEVLTGAGGRSLITGDVLGDVPNVAARLQQDAAPGDIVLTQATRRLVHDAVTVEAMGDLVIRGRSAPVVAYRLLGLGTSEAPAGKGALVGRSTPLRALERCLREVRAENRGRLITVVGPPGVGKSRLVEEFVTRLGPEPRVLIGRCLSYGQGITFWPLVEVVRQVAGLSAEDTIEGVREGLAAALDGCEGAERVVEVMCAMVGIGPRQTSAAEISGALRVMLSALARDRPLVLELDDLHWAEPTLLDVIDQLVEQATGAPIMVVGAARDELLESHPAWGAGDPLRRVIRLGPLDARAVTTMLTRLGSSLRLSRDVRRQIAAASEGNPLFLRHLVDMMRDEAATTGSLKLPGTLQSLLVARLDGLPDEDREVMHAAAVVGREFSRDAVAALLPANVAAGLEDRLRGLCGRDLLTADSLAGTAGAYQFQHILVRDAAYQTLSRESRARLHEQLATWMERGAARIGEPDEIVAYHLEQSYQLWASLRPPDEVIRRLGSRAALSLASAGRRSLQRGDVPGAANLLGRGAGLVPPDDPRRLDMVMLQARAHRSNRAYPAARLLLEEVIEVAQASGQESVYWNATMDLGMIQLLGDPTTQPAAWAPVAERAIAVFEASGDQLGLARAWLLLTEANHFQGNNQEALQAATRGLACATRAGDQFFISEFVRYRARALFFGATPVVNGLQLCLEMLAAADQNALLEALLQRWIGGFHGLRGDFEEAHRHLDRARQLSGELGLSDDIGWRNVSAIVLTMEGRLAEAEAVLRPAAREETTLGLFVRATYAELLCARGRFAQARRVAEAVSKRVAHDDHGTQSAWRNTAALASAEVGDLESALALARTSVEFVDRSDEPVRRGRAREVLAEVYRRLGDLQGEHDALTEALQLFDAKGAVPLSARVRARLEALGPPAAPPAADPHAEWRQVQAATTAIPVRPLLLRALELKPPPADVLELGPGPGNDARHMVSRGYRVTAVDIIDPIDGFLESLPPKGDFNFVRARFEDFAFAAYDLISAQFSLPFIRRSEFEPVLRRVVTALRPGGIFTGQFFGPRDEWSDAGSEVVITDPADVPRLLDGLAVVSIEEEEREGRLAIGGSKHWHLVHVIARRPAS